MGAETIEETKPTLTVVPDLPADVSTDPPVFLYELGEVVFLNSSRVGGGMPMTIMKQIAPEGEEPNRYKLLAQSKDGSVMLEVTLPEYALASAERD